MKKFPAEIYKIIYDMSLHSNVQLPYEDALMYLETIGHYNGFDYKQVRAMLFHLDQMLPRLVSVPVDNPNFNKPQWEIAVGRENSPVIYITFYAFNSHAIKQAVEMFENQERFEEVARGFGKCDEFDLKIEHLDGAMNPESKKITIRMWWD